MSESIDIEELRLEIDKCHEDYMSALCKLIAEPRNEESAAKVDLLKRKWVTMSEMLFHVNMKRFMSGNF